MSDDIIAHARRSHAATAFAVADAWRTRDLWRALERFRACRRPSDGAAAEDDDGPLADVVYVDVGGLSGDDGILEALALLAGIGTAIEPRAIVIKSACMRKLASQLRSFTELWLKQRAR